MSSRYELTAADFGRFSRMIRQASGINFSVDKAEVLKSGLAHRASIVGAPDLGKYYDFINGAGGGNELSRLVEYLSVQETQFFRNQPQFDALRQYVIPELARRNDDRRLLRIWCAGCSTGEEPYSVAMTLLDVLPGADSWDIRVLATDLNEAALSQAIRGWYPERKITGVDRLHRRRYFYSEDGGFRVIDDVRRLVRFQRHNLVGDPLPVESRAGCDAVFCRNVIIYFNRETAKFVIEHFYDIINSGGYLFLGHSETLWQMSTKYGLVEMGSTFIYRKPGAGEEDGRLFIPDRRLRNAGLPPGVRRDRRGPGDRRLSGRAGPTELPGRRESETHRHECRPAGPPPEEVKERARRHIDAGEFEQAANLIKQGLDRDIADAEAYFLLGIAHEKRGELAAALEDFRRALYLDPDFSLAYFHLASLFEQNGNSKCAIREYRNAGRSFAKNPPGAWETELEAFDPRSLVNLCRHKIKTLKQSA